MSNDAVTDLANQIGTTVTALFCVECGPYYAKHLTREILTRELKRVFTKVMADGDRVWVEQPQVLDVEAARQQIAKVITHTAYVFENLLCEVGTAPVAYYHAIQEYEYAHTEDEERFTCELHQFLDPSIRQTHFVHWLSVQGSCLETVREELRARTDKHRELGRVCSSDPVAQKAYMQLLKCEPRTFKNQEGDDVLVSTATQRAIRDEVLRVLAANVNDMLSKYVEQVTREAVRRVLGPYYECSEGDTRHVVQLPMPKKITPSDPAEVFPSAHTSPLM